MKNPELFHRTVNILVKAYFDDTLQSSNCHACAVGNIVAAAEGINLVSNSNSGRLKWGYGQPEWQAVHGFCNGIQRFNDPSWGNRYEGLRQIAKTGYTFSQTAKIEYAFETSASKHGDFSGLMSVIDALMLIHEATETEANDAKKLFTKELAV